MALPKCEGHLERSRRHQPGRRVHSYPRSNAFLRIDSIELLIDRLLDAARFLALGFGFSEGACQSEPLWCFGTRSITTKLFLKSFSDELSQRNAFSRCDRLGFSESSVWN